MLDAFEKEIDRKFIIQSDYERNKSSKEVDTELFAESNITFGYLKEQYKGQADTNVREKITEPNVNELGNDSLLTFDNNITKESDGALTSKTSFRVQQYHGRRKSDKYIDKINKNSIRVDSQKVDSLMNQVGELVVNRSEFTQLLYDIRELQKMLQKNKKLNGEELYLLKLITSRINDATLTLSRVASAIQENVMKVRMLPIAQLFSRYPRLVHDLAKTTNKNIELNVRGEDTELDKMIIEQLADPLMHIIRNAVDHGIESPEERRRKGKDADGQILLNAYYEGNDVVIEVSDDGKGIDTEKVKKYAIQNKFAKEIELEGTGEEDIIKYIMLPGFSTSDVVTHTSGRGVGMDVVKEHIDKLNGTINIINEPGKGVCFKIKIPLTLAIIQALLVKVGSEIFTIPLFAISETIRIKTNDISTIEGLEVFYLRNEPVPIIRLNNILIINKLLSEKEDISIVIANADGKTIGIVVDELLKKEEVVIKPIEDYLQIKSGFSGATILGDGTISLIIDVNQIAEISAIKTVKSTTKKLTAVH
jgi:two-component system chemotaxis sensor kinase CheA